MDFEKILNQSPELISILDLKGNYKYVNKACIKEMGYSKKYFLKKKCFDFVHPDEVKAVTIQS